jgi:predicted dehydrogenase
MGPVVSVSGRLARLVAPARIPDVATTLLQFESGAQAYVGSSYASPWARAVRLFGSRGNARWDGGGDLILDTADGTHSALPLDPVDTLAEQLADFASSIQREQRPEVDGLVALRNVAVMEAAIESNRRGEAVTILEIYSRAGALDLMAEAER